MRTQSGNSQSRKALKPAVLALFSVSALFFTGCGTQPFTETAVHTLAVKGTALGGQPPVTGATITLYATGQSGYGSGRTTLGSTTSDASGNFSIASATGCPDPEEVYIVATGGNPGLTAGTNNNALVLVAALGNCSSVSASTHVVINEVTTIAAAYALSGFAGTSGVNIGTSTNNPLGLQHAFLNAANIVDFTSGTARSTTPAGNGTVPAATINSLADILESCINSASASSSTCTTLFTNATPPAATGISAPTNTWQAALDMAQYPGNNTGTLYGLMLGTPSFQPNLGATAPNDLSLGVLYTAGLETDGATTATFPFGIAADASDNIWITGMTGAGLVELSSNGTLESPAAGGYGNATLQAAFTHQVAADLHGNIITADSASTPNIYIFNPTTTTTTVIQPGGLALSGIAIDSGNNIWFSSRTSATSGQALGQLAYTSGVFASTPTTFSVSTPLPGTGTYALTVDATNNNVWAPNQTAGVSNYFQAPYNVAPASLTTGDTTNYAVAIDKNDNAWIAGTGSGANGSHLFMSPHGVPSLLQATYQPTVTAGTGTVCGTLHGCGLYNPRSLMVDGNNRLFISSFSAGMIVEFDPSVGTTGGNPGTFYLTAEGNGFNPSNNQTNSITPAASTTPIGLISTSAPRTIAIDAAGSLWTINATTGTAAPVVQILGIAAPTNPILAAGQYGVKP